jgi:hypothetical protein
MFALEIWCPWVSKIAQATSSQLVTMEDGCLAPRVDPSRDEDRHTMLMTCLPSKWQRTISRRNSLPPRGARSAAASIDIYQRYREIGLLLPSQMRGRVGQHVTHRRRRIDSVFSRLLVPTIAWQRGRRTGRRLGRARPLHIQLAVFCARRATREAAQVWLSALPD